MTMPEAADVSMWVSYMGAADAIDTWLTRGGSLPQGWQFAREAG